MKRILHFLRQFVLSDDLAGDLSEVIVFIDLEGHRDITLELYCDSTEQLALFCCRLKRLLGLKLLMPLGVAISVYNLSMLLVLGGLRLLGLSGRLSLVRLARLVALATVVLLVIELLGAILVIVVLAISIV